MTEELEQKAEEYADNCFSGGDRSSAYYRRILIKGYKDGYKQGQKGKEELKAQIEKMKKVMTDVFEDMEADMCSTDNKILFDYLKRFLKKYEVIV